MFQTFFTNTIKSGYIKNLLEDTYLPMYTSVHKGDYIVAGVRYCYNCYVIRCTQSGYIEPYDDEITDTTPIAKFVELDHYVFGHKTNGLTNKFISRDVYYDSRTHRQLGEYLRHYRDYYGVNLMPLYNCFDYTTLDDIYLHTDRNGKVYTEEHNPNYKVLSVPIKFNRDYTIALQCHNNVMILPVVYGHNGLVKESFDSEDYLTDKLIQTNPLKQVRLNFNTPYKIRINNDDEIIQKNEKFLRLLIQLPVNNESSVVVLEGDFTQDITRNVFDVPYLLKNKPYKLNDLLISNVSLLKMNTNETYAFSNRLLEYLSGNAITKMDTYDKDIERVQDALHLNVSRLDRGVWSDSLRLKIYNEFTKNTNINNIEKRDILGYVDKDVEKFLNC